MSTTIVFFSDRYFIEQDGFLELVGAIAYEKAKERGSIELVFEHLYDQWMTSMKLGLNFHLERFLTDSDRVQAFAVHLRRARDKAKSFGDMIPEEFANRLIGSQLDRFCGDIAVSRVVHVINGILQLLPAGDSVEP